MIDYADAPAGEFVQDGFIFGDRPRGLAELYLDGPDGSPQVADATAAVNDSIFDGLESTSQSILQTRSKLSGIPRSGRTLRTPTFELTDATVTCRVRGSGHVVACVDSHRLIAGPLHGETIEPIKPTATWVTLDLKRYVGHRIHLEFTPASDETLEVYCVVQGGSKRQMKQRDALHAETESIAAQIQTDLDRYLADASESARHSQSVISAWLTERKIIRESKIVRSSRLAMAMMDGTSENDHVLIRGSSDNPGDVVARHFLTAISGDDPLPIRTRSGRLELAACINDPSNPLTSRVIVNRVWHHLMGRGIVPTTDDFGVLGLPPTHPELLDHLATKFRSEGQSIKKLIRYIVSSRTYQMASRVDKAAEKADPKNLLWHHRPPKRLEGEIIRDSLLAISGRLDRTLYGEPVPVHLTSFMDGRGRPKHSGPIDGDSRRSIYTAVRRNFLSPFMLAFDTPVPFSSMGRRNVSNVPAQALVMLNHPLVSEQTRFWAERAIELFPGAEDARVRADRIEWMYLRRAVTTAQSTGNGFGRRLFVFLRQGTDERDRCLGRLRPCAGQYQGVHFSAMSCLNRFPCRRHQSRPWSRREMLTRCGSGFGAVALAALSEKVAFGGKETGRALHGTHHAPTAKQVIFLYMDGGPSQVDTFDPKPMLDKYDGARPGAILQRRTDTVQQQRQGLGEPLEIQSIR